MKKTKARFQINLLYLLQEAVLFLLVSYLITLGGTFNGVVLFPVHQASIVLILVFGVAWFSHPRTWISRSR